MVGYDGIQKGLYSRIGRWSLGEGKSFLYVNSLSEYE